MKQINTYITESLKEKDYTALGKKFINTLSKIDKSVRVTYEPGMSGPEMVIAIDVDEAMFATRENIFKTVYEHEFENACKVLGCDFDELYKGTGEYHTFYDNCYSNSKLTETGCLLYGDLDFYDPHGTDSTVEECNAASVVAVVCAMFGVSDSCNGTEYLQDDVIPVCEKFLNDVKKKVNR